MRQVQLSVYLQKSRPKLEPQHLGSPFHSLYIALHSSTLIPHMLLNLLTFSFYSSHWWFFLYWWLMDCLWLVKPVFPWTVGTEQKPYIFDLQNKVHQKWFISFVTMAFRIFILSWFRNKNENRRIKHSNQGLRNINLRIWMNGLDVFLEKLEVHIIEVFVCLKNWLQKMYVDVVSVLRWLIVRNF